MYNVSREKRGWWIPTAIVASLLMGGAALASAGWLAGPGLRDSQVKAWLDAAQAHAVVPLSGGEPVLRELHRLVDTPEGRAWLRGAFARMPEHLPLVQQRLLAYGLPSELAALPLLESGYRNDLVSPGLHAAGIWQFIPSTARRYSLRVEPGLDERADIPKETEAAAQLLRDLHGEFQDWLLTLKAYNEGAEHVRSLIQKYGTRDAWELERRETAEGYLPKAIAAILVFQGHAAGDL